MKLKIHPKTKKILNKILKINISKEKDLNIDLAKVADSLKYLEILLMTEKESKKKIKNNKILKKTIISIIAGPAARANGKKDNKKIFKFSIFFINTIRF